MSTSSDKISVLLVDDQSSIHREIGALLMALDDIELVAQGSTGEEAIRLCDQYRPDLVLMDIGMPVMNGIDATRVIMERHPHTKIIAMTGMDDTKTVQSMIAAGVVGYILKDTHPEELINTIRAVNSGNSVFSTEIVKPLLKSSPQVAQPHPEYGLTRREIEILHCMVSGQTNPEIAETLTISQATVKFHISNTLRKLAVKTRAAAIALAVHQGLIE